MVRRAAGHIIAAVSLLVMIATLCLWVRSYLRSDGLVTAGGRHVYRTAPGAVWFTWTSQPYFFGRGYGSREPDTRFDRQNRSWSSHADPIAGTQSKQYRGAGFGWFAYDQPSTVSPCRFVYVGVPMWAIVLLSAIAPAVWWRRRRLARRIAVGHCPTCGYDLRASRDRCPECGQAARDATRSAESSGGSVSVAAGR